MSQTALIYTKKDIEMFARELIRKEIKPLVEEVEKLRININDLMQMRYLK